MYGAEQKPPRFFPIVIGHANLGVRISSAFIQVTPPFFGYR